MQVRVLGEVDVLGDDGETIALGQRKLRELVSVLALEDGPLTSGRLQTMLWGEADTQNMTSALTSSVMRLRELLPPGRLVHDEAGYRLVLDAEGDYLDIREFRELIATARRCSPGWSYWRHWTPSRTGTPPSAHQNAGCVTSPASAS